MGVRRSKRWIINAAYSDLRSMRKSAIDIQMRNHLNNARRRRVASRIRSRTVQQFLKAANIDLQAAERRHARDSATMKRHYAAQRRRILTAGKARAKRQQQNLRKLHANTLKAMQVARSPQLRSIGLLIRADDIKGETFQGQTSDKVKFAKEWSHRALNLKNTVDADFKVETGRGDSGFLVADFDFLFIWRCDQTGLLNSYATLLSNGGYLLRIFSSCVANPRAEIKISTWYSARQVDTEGNIAHGGSGVIDLLEREAKEPGALVGLIESNEITPFEDTIDLSVRKMPVVEGNYVVFSVTVHAELQGVDGGDAEVDLMINVPWMAYEVY